MKDFPREANYSDPQILAFYYGTEQEVQGVVCAPHGREQLKVLPDLRRALGDETYDLVPVYSFDGVEHICTTCFFTDPRTTSLKEHQS